MLMVFVPTAYAASTPPDFSDGWIALTSADGGKTFNGGNYYLNDDITIDDYLTFCGDVKLDLNGHVIKLNSYLYGGSAIGSVINLCNFDSNSNLCATNFTLQDSNPTAKHYFSKQTDGLWKWEPTITEATKGYELVEGGVITGGNASEGGGIYAYRDQTVTLVVNINGGNIVGCQASQGGGINNNEGNLTLDSCNIIGCQASDGGGIYNYYGVLTVKNASVKYCIAADEGGGICNCYEALNLNDTDIIGCDAYYGGGIFGGSSVVTIENGCIKDCTADADGGGVYNDFGTFTMNGTSIENCSASIYGGNGGGVQNYAGIFNMNSTTIKNCTAKNNGGGVRSYVGTFTMNGASIENCTATENGGGFANTEGNFKMTGGLIKNCTATNNPNSNAYIGLGRATLYADGGVIDGTANFYDNIKRSADAKGTTVFNGKVTYSRDIEAGIFYGSLEKAGNGAIVGNTYTVKFFENDTDTEPFATALVVGDGTILVPPTMPEREGYTLVWYTEGGDEYTFDSAVDSDFSLYAKFVQVDSGDTDSDLPVWLDILLSLLKLVFKILVDKGIF